jgi:cyclophilin family peptidyl-prolyl cis-trans isomerase/protein-disulfide isomerase
MKTNSFSMTGRKSSLWILICISLFTACSSPTPSPAISTPVPTPSPVKMPCTILPYGESPAEAMAAFIDEFGHVAGPENALVTILVFTDFQCPGCALLAASLEQIRNAHPTDVRLIVRYLPDQRFDKSSMAMQAAEAADQQGKFWEMYLLLFEKQPDWYGLDPAAFPAWAGEQAVGLGMDADQFEADFNSELVQVRVMNSLQAAASISYLPPLLFINNGSPYNGMADASSLDTMVRLAMLEERKLHSCPGWTVDPSRQYIVTLHTAKGDAVIQLYPEKAPLAVNNFIFLARSGWYDLIPFYRVDPDFVAQTGDPSGTGFGYPGYYFATEAAAGLTFNRPGLLAMANTGVDTNGSQFFITFSADHSLDGKFTIFGEVLTGMDVLASLSAGDLLLSVKVEDH